MRGAIVADQSISFTAMKEKLEQFIAILQADPAIEAATGTIGGGFGPGGSINSRICCVTLKPLRERGVSADEVIARLRPKFAKIPGASLFLQSVQDIRMGGRASNALFQYTLQADDLAELDLWRPASSTLEAQRNAPRRQLRPAGQGPANRYRDRPRQGLASRPDSERHRQHALRRVWSAASFHDLQRSINITS